MQNLHLQRGQAMAAAAQQQVGLHAMTTAGLNTRGLSSAAAPADVPPSLVTQPCLAPTGSVSAPAL